MVDESEEGKEPGWRQRRRTGLFVIGLAAIVAGPVLLFFGPDPQAGWTLMIAGLIFMVASRFDDVVEIGFGSFRTKLERRVREVEDAMGAVWRLAKASAGASLSSVQYVGRMGGFTETEKTRFFHDTRRLLNDLGIEDDEIAETELGWHRAVEFDYALWATGLNQVPRNLPPAFHARWDNLRKGGIENRATPEEIRALFTAANMLTPEREEILEDYEHYVATQQHRREDAWRRRQERE